MAATIGRTPQTPPRVPRSSCIVMTGMSAPYRTVDPYTDLDVIDTRGPRTNQAVVAIGTLLAYLLQQEWIVALLALQMIVGLTLGRRY